MLYEVITTFNILLSTFSFMDPRRAYPRTRPDRRSADIQLRRTCQRPHKLNSRTPDRSSHRITSYNVCYTKLLRNGTTNTAVIAGHLFQAVPQIHDTLSLSATASAIA